MKKILLTAVVPLILFTACKDREAALYPDTGEVFAKIERVELSEEVTEDRIRCTLTGQYPQISGLTNEDILAKINATLKAKTADISVQKLNNCPNELSDILIADDELLNEITTKFGLHKNEKGILSLSYNTTTQLEGAAHPNNDNVGITLDLRTGEIYELRDIVSDSYDIETTLKEKLASSKAGQSISPEALENMNIDNAAFYLKRGNLVFTNLFDVHAIQGITVEIPFTELQDDAKQDGPIPQLLAK